MFFLYMREEYAVEDQHQHVVGGKNQRKGQNARLVATEKESSDEDDDDSADFADNAEGEDDYYDGDIFSDSEGELDDYDD